MAAPEIDQLFAAIRGLARISESELPNSRACMVVAKRLSGVRLQMNQCPRGELSVRFTEDHFHDVSRKLRKAR